MVITLYWTHMRDRFSAERKLFYYIRWMYILIFEGFTKTFRYDRIIQLKHSVNRDQVPEPWLFLICVSFRTLPFLTFTASKGCPQSLLHGFLLSSPMTEEAWGRGGTLSSLWFSLFISSNSFISFKITLGLPSSTRIISLFWGQLIIPICNLTILSYMRILWCCCLLFFFLL